MVKTALCILVAVALAAAGAGEIQYGPARESGTLANPLLVESSGIVAGRANPGLFWSHNDSGDQPRLYAVGPAGEDRGTYQILGVVNKDWEDISAARINEVDYLILADTGDNDQTKTAHWLYFVAEPKIQATANPPQRPIALRPALVLSFRYPDQPHNCEAVAYDPSSHSILLATKTIFGSASIFRIPVPTDFSQVAAVAPELIARIWVNAVTAMDISPDGRRLLLGTYGPAYEYTRADNETWLSALARPPRKLSMPRRPQGEGLCYGPDGRSIHLTSEGKSSAFWLVPASP